MASITSLGEIPIPKRSRREENRCIPEELLEEILSRLPVESLLRFKSVCKTWYFRLNSRSFIDSHNRHRSRHFPGQLVCSPYACTMRALKNKSTALVNLVAGPSHLLFPEPMFWVRQTFTEGWRRVFRVFGPLNNGIYCVVVNLHKDSLIELSGGKIVFCNPSTHEYRFASSFPYDCDTRSLLDNLESNPSRIHYGFGSVDNNSDYKFVVIIRRGVRFNSFLSFVYSLRSGEWKRIADYEPLSLKRRLLLRDTLLGLIVDNRKLVYPHISDDLELCPQRFFNGCWHWMARGDNVYYVLSFNFADDAFKYIRGPPGHSDYDPNVKGGVFVFNDHLATIYLSHDDLLLSSGVRCIEVDVWMMMEYGVEQSWTRVYNIKPDFHGELCKLVGILTRTLRDGEGGHGNLIERIFFQDNDKWLISCDDTGYKVHGVCDISSLVCWNTPGISTYIETLECLEPRNTVFSYANAT